jgi:hypothetical protein
VVTDPLGEQGSARRPCRSGPEPDGVEQMPRQHCAAPWLRSVVLMVVAGAKVQWRTAGEFRHSAASLGTVMRAVRTIRYPRWW